MLKTGDTAPDFTLPDQNGEEVTLSDLRGETVVLYFYPRADTPGLHNAGVRHPRSPRVLRRRRRARARDLPDQVKAVAKFAGKFDLNFTLLADADHAVADEYGTWVEKSMYGKKYMGVQRATFVIDAEGKIANVIEKASPKTHADDVLALLG